MRLSQKGSTMSELIIRQPSEELKQKLEGVATSLRNAASLVDEVFTMGRKEGFSDSEIGQMIRDRLSKLGYNPRSIRRLLPPSAKDLTKSRKGNHGRSHDSSIDGMHEDKMSSFENQNDFDENRQILSSEVVDAFQVKIDSLNEQLSKGQSKYEDLTIRYKNSLTCQQDLRSKLQAVNEDVQVLHLTREKFPPNFGQVFDTQDHAFAVEFKGSKVLDITVITQHQIANDKIMYVSDAD
jgi:hypothetical protein